MREKDATVTAAGAGTGAGTGADASASNGTTPGLGNGGGGSMYHGILSSYADLTGHAPVLPNYATGFWQSKMRYRSADEIVAIAEGYRARNVSLAVIVIDFYTWTKVNDLVSLSGPSRTRSGGIDA